jgi:hypothetical protein
MVFVEHAEDVDAGDVLRPRAASVSPGHEAALFLLRALADGAWHDSVGLKTLAGAQKVSERTLQRAAKDLGVESERRGFPASTWWRLPQSRHDYVTQYQEVGATVETAIPSGSRTALAPVVPVAPAPKRDVPPFLPENIPADAPAWEIDYWQRRNGQLG